MIVPNDAVKFASSALLSAALLSVSRGGGNGNGGSSEENGDSVCVSSTVMSLTDVGPLDPAS